MPLMSTVAVIPARRGSKGLPRKHLRRLGGIPLVSYTISAALEAVRVDRVIVSTDDPEVAAIATKLGAQAPFLRPAHLAQDDTPTYPVIQHAVDFLEGEGVRIDLVVTLQPTSPLRGPDQIDATIALLDSPAVQSATTIASTGIPVNVVGISHKGRFVPFAPEYSQGRQRTPDVYRLTGGVYVSRRSLLGSGRLLDDRPAGLIVDATRAIDIDSLEDLTRARRALRAAPTSARAIPSR